MNDSASSQPLAGVRVFELGIAIAAPSCTRQMALFGADVFKIESLNNPDVVRIFGTVWTRDDPDLAAVHPDLSAYVTEMATAKRSVGLDLKVPAGREAALRLLATCDVLVTNYSAPAIRALGLDYESVRAVRPDIIYVALPGFGSDPTTPYYEHVAWGPNQAPLVGLDNLTGFAERDPAGIGPIAPPDYCSGLVAATAVLSGLRQRRRTGAGVFVDISQFEASVGLLGPLFLDLSLNGHEQQRTGNRCSEAAPEGVYRCRGDDRWVAISVDSDEAWLALRALVAGSSRLGADWPGDSNFATQQSRRDHCDELDVLLSSWTEVHSPDEVAAWCQEVGVAAYCVLDLEDVICDPQVRDRRWFGVAPSARLKSDVFHSSALRLTDTPGFARRAAPAMGEDTLTVLTELGYDEADITEMVNTRAAFPMAPSPRPLQRPYHDYLPVLVPAARDSVDLSAPEAGQKPSALTPTPPTPTTPTTSEIDRRGGPLAGLRVIDFGGLNGAYGTMMLAGLGANVTIVEPPTGDRVRGFGPRSGLVPDGPESAMWFAFLAQGKRSIVADLSLEADRERIRALLAQADVVIDGLGTGYLDGLGIGYEAAKTTNPGLVWVSITPFGLTGPRRNWKSSNLVAWASSGVLALTGFPQDAPVVPGGPSQLACHVTAMHSAVGALMALHARDCESGLGRGQLVDMSMQECCLALAPEAGVSLFLDDRIHRVRTGNRRALSRPWGLYRCQDGFVATIALQPVHWTNTAKWISEATGNDMFLDEAFHDLTMRAQIADIIDEWFAQLTLTSTKLALFAEGQRRNVPVTPLNTLADLRRDPHLRATGFFETVDHPVLGSYERPGPPMRTNRDWWSLGRAPLLGEHT